MSLLWKGFVAGAVLFFRPLFDITNSSPPYTITLFPSIVRDLSANPFAARVVLRLRLPFGDAAPLSVYKIHPPDGSLTALRNASVLLFFTEPILLGHRGLRITLAPVYGDPEDYTVSEVTHVNGGDLPSANTMNLLANSTPRRLMACIGTIRVVPRQPLASNTRYTISAEEFDRDLWLCYDSLLECAGPLKCMFC